MSAPIPLAGARRILGIALLAVITVGCGVSTRGESARGIVAGDGDIEVTGTPIGEDPDADPDRDRVLQPPVDLEVSGLVPSDVNLIATTAIADLEEWWAEEYPRVFGDDYLPLVGGLHAYDSGTDPQLLPCLEDLDDIEVVLFNAFYCPPEDAVLWDQEILLPSFAEDHGDFAVAVVLAHEWGHVIQSPRRSGQRASPIVEDLQADCYAGAWARHARDRDRPYFDVNGVALDGALAALLDLRDPPGGMPEDEGAHGSGFDRVNAFQDGFLNSATSCADYTDGSLDFFQFEFLDEDDHHADGDMPLADIKIAAIESLEAFWTDQFPTVSGGDAWTGLEGKEFSEGSPPVCGGEPVSGYRLFLCWPDRYVGFSSEAAAAAYDTGIGGDFAVAALLATQYGLGVQLALGHDLKEDPVLATLRGDCYAGAWGAELIERDGRPVPPEWELVLSPGDLDEGISVLLSFRTESDRARQGAGFDRVTAFRTGVLDGIDACADYTPASGG